MESAEFDFATLAAAKGLNQATIKVLVAEDLTSAFAISLLESADIEELRLTLGQKKIFVKWVEDLKLTATGQDWPSLVLPQQGGSDESKDTQHAKTPSGQLEWHSTPDMTSAELEFATLAESKGLNEETIKTLLDAGLDSVLLPYVTLDDINLMELTTDQTNLLAACVEELRDDEVQSEVTDRLSSQDQSTNSDVEVEMMALKEMDMPDDRRKATEEYIKEKGLEGLDSYLKNELDNYKKSAINIAVAGASGMGKSSLINSMRGVKPNTKGAAATGSTQTTMEATPYAHPEMPNVVLWDLPGSGTQTFNRDNYVVNLKLNINYDAIIVCNSGRFKEDDLMISTAAKEANIPFYIVRTKIDDDIRNGPHDYPGVNKKGILQSIKSEIQRNLKVEGLDTNMIFLINTRERHMFDYPLLMEQLVNHAPEKNQTAMVLALMNVSENGIKRTKTEIKKRVPEFVMCLSVTATTSEIRHMIQKELLLYKQQFGLTKEHMDDLGIITGSQLPMLDVSERLSRWLFKIIIRLFEIVRINRFIGFGLRVRNRIISTINNFLDKYEKAALDMINVAIKQANMR